MDSQIGEAATELQARLQAMGFGPMHDRLPSAWVACLDGMGHKGYGVPAGGRIRVPTMSS